MDLSTITALFNIMVGVMLVAAVLLMLGGLGVWYVRLGTYPTYRDDAIKIMQWGVSILFVLTVLLGIAQFVQTHMALSMMVIGAVVAAAVVYVVGTTFLASGGDHEEHH